MAALADGWVSCGGKRKPWNYGTVEALARDKCCECAPLAADAVLQVLHRWLQFLNRIMVPAESSAPTFEDTLAASENLFEKTCEILGIPKTETQILAEDDTGMLIPRPAAPRCLDRTMERIAEQDIAAVDTRLPKQPLNAAGPDKRKPKRARTSEELPPELIEKLQALEVPKELWPQEAPRGKGSYTVQAQHGYQLSDFLETSGGGIGSGFRA